MNDGQPVYLALDLWMALGFDSGEFGAYYERNGWDDTWARMLDVVRGPRTTCAKAVDGDDWCVLKEGHEGAHYGVGDVGPPNDLLVKYWQIHHGPLTDRS